MTEPFETNYSDSELPRRNNRPLIIALIVVLVLCCCCALIAAAGLGWLWTYGDNLVGISQSLSTPIFAIS
jgi:fatty acid desaturase